MKTNPRSVIPLASLLALMAGASPARAEAPDLQDILNELASYGIIDKDLADAAPVVQCVVDGGSVEGCVKQKAAAKANELLASDSKLVLAVDLAKAVNAGDWVRILELSGTKVLRVLLCDAANPVIIPGGKAITGVICSGAFDLLMGMAETVVADAVDAIADHAYWRLLTLVGPKVACEIIPGDNEVHDVACGILGEIWEGIEQTVSGAVSLVGNVGDMFGDALQGAFDFMDDLLGTGHDKMAPAAYYMTYIASYYMNGVYGTLDLGTQAVLSRPKFVYDKCMEYYDESGICAPMRDRYVADVVAYAAAISAFRDTYYTAEVQPALPYYYVKWIQAGKPKILPGTYQVPSPCFAAITVRWPTVQYPLPSVTTGTSLNPLAWACLGPAERLTQALTAQGTVLAGKLAELESKGCQIKKGGQTAFPFQCTSVEGFQRCEVLFAGTELVRTSLAAPDGKPDPKLCNFVLPAKQPVQPVVENPNAGIAVDLLAEPSVSVLTRGQTIPSQWGTVVELAAAAKLPPTQGVDSLQCRFELDITVRNGGTVASPGFDNRIAVDGQPQASRKMGPVAAGATRSQRLAFLVRPGRHAVDVRLDDGDVVTEASEKNNRYRLPVNVSGSCAPVLSDSVPATGVARAGAVVLPTMIVVEGEDLVRGGAFTADGGRVTTRAATSYARSRDAAGTQLVWSGGRPGSVLALTVDVPVAASYVLELHITSGPDYGDVQVEVDGERGPLIRGFSPRATPSRPLQAGRFGLEAGTHRISFRVVERYATSTGYAFGLDFIRLVPAGPIRRP